MELVTTSDMKALVRATVADRERRRGETFFFWHEEARQMQWGTNEELIVQMKVWRKAQKEQKIKLRACNNATKLINGQEWFILTVQDFVDQVANPCRLGLGFDTGYMVSGSTYVFKHQQNRDATYKYVMCL